MVRQIVGKISSDGNRTDWNIRRLFSFLQDDKECTLYSPKFCVAERSWNLFARLGKWLEIGIYQETNLNSDFNVRLGIKRKSVEISTCGTLSCGGRGVFNIVDRSEMESKKDQWVPEGNLCVIFIIEDLKRNCEKTLFSQAATDIGLRKLQNDFEFLLKGSLSDVAVKVRDEEFQCHKCILAARSPVFLAMMTHDTKENATGVIQIDDADPKHFADFLHYLYTGYVKNLFAENAPALYTISDKYQVMELKDNCINYMRENISMENFCDIIALSLRHGEKELTNACIQFFKDTWNSLEIIKTSKWQTFMSENPIACNELLIKLLESKKS